ncbi:DUF3499 domain-containing protein [Brachybacterium aquaticum]|uniref:DUF3499 domain-containing protein n=1 Tax=Brachybacterium aquaticum TaxID=1432564 RepID=A0A841A6Y2_9MICO|nr:DUF3499 domain-containing protein [Brachybacterium aquaticum]MBB5830929.1 hypothetical protein [Brachybacterium aquaticum]
MPARECSRTACSKPAVSSLTFVYEDSTAVLGPLSRQIEPHAYDLCHEHASRMTAPLGWELLRVAGGEDVSDDLVALADAVRRRPAAVPGATVPGATVSGAATGVGGPAAPSAARPSRAPGAHGQADQGRHRAAGHRPAADGDTARHLHVIRSSDD